ncbi:MAG: hypothetical protein Q4P33_07105 [Flaviflexus sp.]|nr:hypothetical protein [Flaviflexus sp.]
MTHNDTPAFLSDSTEPQRPGAPAAQQAPTPAPEPAKPSKRELKRERKAQEKADAKAEKAAQSEGGTLPWIALLVGLIVITWRAIFGYRTVGLAAGDSLHTLSNMGAIMLGLATLVLGIVALAQRRRPTWPAVAASAIGLQAFAVGIVTWLATL